MPAILSTIVPKVPKSESMIREAIQTAMIRPGPGWRVFQRHDHSELGRARGSQLINRLQRADLRSMFLRHLDQEDVVFGPGPDVRYAPDGDVSRIPRRAANRWWLLSGRSRRSELLL